MKTATATVNLFATANKTEPKKTGTTKEKEKIFVSGIETDLLRKAEIKAELNNLKAEDEMISGRLKEIARDQYLKKYHLQKSRPDSFHLADGNGKVMVIVMDAYKKVEDAKEAALQAYPGVIETTTVYTINPEVLAKEGVGEALSAAIMNCKGLSQEDKTNLLQATETKQVKKGTIDRLLTFDNPDQLFYLIEPTVALK